MSSRSNAITDPHINVKLITAKTIAFQKSAPVVCSAAPMFPNIKTKNNTIPKPAIFRAVSLFIFICLLSFRSVYSIATSCNSYLASAFCFGSRQLFKSSRHCFIMLIRIKAHSVKVIFPDSTSSIYK